MDLTKHLGNLLEALEAGKTLFRQHEGEIETIRMERVKIVFRRYIRSGWGSTVRTTFDVLDEIYTHPDLWAIEP
jgi:hypothetical protein